MAKGGNPRILTVLYAAVGWLGLSMFKPAVAGPRQETVLEVIHSLRQAETSKHREQVAYLHAQLNDSKQSMHEHKLAALALGVQYLAVNPRLALQFLSMVETQSIPGDPLLPIIQFYRANAWWLSGNFAAAAATAQNLLDLGRGDNWSKQVHSLLIESLASSGDDARVVTEFAAYARKFSFSHRQEVLARNAIEALERRVKAPALGEKERQTADAERIGLLEHLARGYPGTEESRWAFRQLEAKACLPASPERYTYSLKLLLNLSQNILLDRSLEPFIIAAIDQPITDEQGTVRRLSSNEKADFLYRAKLFRQALETVKAEYAEVKSRPASAANAEALATLQYEMGRLHLRLQDPMLAARFFNDFMADNPKHPLYRRALEHLGDAMRFLGQPLAASQLYAEALKHHDSNTLRWMHFWSLYRGRDYAGALALLERRNYVTARDGDDSLTVTYWQARILEHLGKLDQAMPIYRDILRTEGGSFYALLVTTLHPELSDAEEGVANSQRLAAAKGKGGEVPGVVMAAKLLASHQDTAAIYGSPSGPAVLQTVRDLAKVGLKDMASLQLSGVKWAGFNQSDSFRAIYDLSDALGDYRPSRNLRYTSFSALRALPRGWGDIRRHQGQNVDEWRIYYPLAYRQIVLPVAARLHLSPFLILSIMRAESYYNKEARSGVGALGLMQLMPYTALKIALELHDERFNPMEVSKPELNIPYGAYYIDKLVRYYDGNPFLAAAAYNAGPIIVNQWLDSCRDCAVDEFVDSIPYRETRHYVREVIRNYAVYAQIYTGTSVLSKLDHMPAALPDGEELY